jgi:hypothetical protein
MIHKPWTDGAHAYIELDRLSDVAGFSSRLRKTQWFILRDPTHATCDRCDKPIAVADGNRCTFQPKTKRVACMHYYCSWESTMEAVAQIGGAA